jgi:hypothetical protein
MARQLIPAGAPTIRYRPVVSVRVSGPAPLRHQWRIGDAFVDTGTDFTVFRQQIADLLGLSAFVHNLHHRWKGHSYSVRFSRVGLELSDGAATASWPANVGFTEAPIPYDCLLGQTGFLEFFDATFRHEDLELDLTPNRRFRRIGNIENP